MAFDITGLKDVCSDLKFKAVKHKADIAFGVGLVGTVTASGLCIRATRKNNPVIDEYIKRRKEIANDTKMSAEEKKAATKENTVAVLKGTAKNYALPMAVEAGSIAALGYGFAKRTDEFNNAATLAAGAISAYELVKSRIIAAEGEEKWREYAHGETIEKKEIVDPETGEVKVETVTNKSHDVQVAELSVWFDDSPSNLNFEACKGANKNFLSLLETTWENKLHMGGKKDVVWLRNVWESTFGTTQEFPSEWANAAAPRELKDGTTNHITFGIRPNENRPLQSFPEDVQAFWRDERPDVRITFTGFVKDIYQYW